MTRHDYNDIAVTVCTAGVLLCLLLAVLTSCTRTVYVPQVSIQKDSIYLTTHTRDSIWLHDSVHVKEKGDTVWAERWHTKYIERLKIDTAYIEHRDTIREPYPVEKQLSFMQRSWIKVGKGSAGFIAATILALLGYMAIRKLKK